MIGMTIFAAMAAVTAAASVALRPSSRSSAMRRLAAMQGNPETPRLSRIGIAAVIAGACAILRGGGTPVEAFEEQMGRRFAVPGITPSRMRALLASRAAQGDRPADRSGGERHRRGLQSERDVGVSGRAMLGSRWRNLSPQPTGGGPALAGVRRASGHGPSAFGAAARHRDDG